VTVQDLEARARALYVLEPVSWKRFARVAVHAHRIRFKAGALDYGGSLSLMARQSARRYFGLVGFDPDDETEWSALRGERALLADLKAFNHRLEDEALAALFAKSAVKVSYWDDWVAFEPKCVHARYLLAWGEVVAAAPVESGRLLEAALRFLKTRGRGGYMTAEDVARLAPRAG
jgi:hypothetical protein